MHEEHDSTRAETLIDRIADARLTPVLVAAGTLLVYFLEAVALAQ